MIRPQFRSRPLSLPHVTRVFELCPTMIIPLLLVYQDLCITEWETIYTSMHRKHANCMLVLHAWSTVYILEKRLIFKVRTLYSLYYDTRNKGHRVSNSTHVAKARRSPNNHWFVTVRANFNWEKL